MFPETQELSIALLKYWARCRLIALTNGNQNMATKHVSKAKPNKFLLDNTVTANIIPIQMDEMDSSLHHHVDVGKRRKAESSKYTVHAEDSPIYISFCRRRINEVSISFI